MAFTPAWTHDTYVAANGKQVRLINDDVLVRMDPLLEKTSGGIVIPDTAGDRGDQGVLATGTVVAYGYLTFGGKKGKPFRRVPLPEFGIGKKVVFTRFYAEQHSNQQLQYRVEHGVIRMKPLDILFTFDPEDAHRVLR